MTTETIFKYGEFEGIFDVSDYEQLEAFENGIEALTAISGANSEEKRTSELFREQAYCITDEIIDPVFGDGASGIMFGDRITSLMVLIDAVCELILFAENQGVEMTVDVSNIKTKLAGNRASRRNLPKSVGPR